MVSRKLMACWAFVDLWLLAAGVLSVALSIVWRTPNVLMNMIVDRGDLTAGLVLGISLLITFAFSIAAIVQRNHVTLPLVILNYMLLIDGIMIVFIGSYIWFFTLHERSNFHARWVNLTRDQRIFLQDKFSCCGYFNAHDLEEVGGNFCNQTQVDFLNTLDLTNTDFSHFFCVSPVTAAADFTLNNIFTTVYGFLAIIICLIMMSLCVINKRKEDERFKKIDAKRGRSFV